MNDFEKKFVEIFVENLGVDEKEVIDQASIYSDLGADSLDAIEIIMTLEREFNIAIQDSELSENMTVHDLKVMVLGLIQNNNQREGEIPVDNIVTKASNAFPGVVIVVGHSDYESVVKSLKNNFDLVKQELDKGNGVMIKIIENQK